MKENENIIYLIQKTLAVEAKATISAGMEDTMKKIAAIILTGAFTLLFAACGNSANQTTQGQTEVSLTEERQTETTSSISIEEVIEETIESGMQENVEAGENILIAYFSWSGNTEQLAQMIQSETGGALFEIVPETAYTEEYDTLLDIAQQEKSDNARPALASHVDNWEEYSTVFIGYPNWWSDAPRVILTFLEEYDCIGKTIVPFCTSGGGGFGSSISSIESSAVGATVAEGFHVGGSGVSNAGDSVAAWLEGLNLQQ